MTLLQTLTWGEEELRKSQVPEAKLNAWYLFEAAFSMDRTKYFLNQEKEAPKEELQAYTKMLEERKKRVPLEHILGQAEFMGLTFQVGPEVLIPRQDTECLVEKILPYCEGKDILDLCCGSGCIGISLGVLGKTKSLTLADLSQGAIEQTKINAEKNGQKARIVQGNLFEHLQEETFDIIVSNPPYIASGEIEELMPEVRDHEPRMALDGRENGLYFYEKIIEESRRHLRADSILAFEIGYDQGEAVADLMRQAGFTQVEVSQDLAGLDRVVMGRLETGGKHV